MSDKVIHDALRELSCNELRWRKTAFPGVWYYYAESGVYAIRIYGGRDGLDERICLVRASNPAEAAEKAIEAFPSRGADAPKNLAVLRDALDKIRDWTVAASEDDTFPPEAFELVRRIRRKAKAALAAPVRNCDRFATFDEAGKAWFDWTETHRNPDGTCDTLSSWLMALAEADKS